MAQHLHTVFRKEKQTSNNIFLCSFHPIRKAAVSKYCRCKENRSFVFVLTLRQQELSHRTASLDVPDLQFLYYWVPYVFLYLNWKIENSIPLTFEPMERSHDR
jgi:hypothetical protein